MGMVRWHLAYRNRKAKCIKYMWFVREWFLSVLNVWVGVTKILKYFYQLKKFAKFKHVDEFSVACVIKLILDAIFGYMAVHFCLVL